MSNRPKLLVATAIALMCCVHFSVYGEHVYYVVPDSYISNHSCPSHGACQTLSHYVKRKTEYFVSNTAFIVLPGLHLLDEEGITLINGVSNLVLKGSYTRYVEDGVNGSSAVIQCRKQSGLAFSDVSNLTVADLVFLDCGGEDIVTKMQFGCDGDAQKNTALFVTLSFNKVKTLNISGVLVQNGSGFGMLGWNVVDAHISRSAFRYNRRSNHFGGNAYFLYDESSDFTSNFNVYSLTIKNAQFVGGGEETQLQGVGLSISFFQHSYQIDVRLDGVVLRGNKADFGGNLHVKDCSNAALFNTIEIHNSSIEAGSSTRGGGLFYISKPTWNRDYPPPCVTRAKGSMNMNNILTISHSHFANNVAQYGGGGAYIAYQTFHVSDNQSVCSTRYIQIQNCTFESNRVDTAGPGTALWVEVKSTSMPEVAMEYQFIVEHSRFLSNSCTRLVDKGVSCTTLQLGAVQKIHFKDSSFLHNNGTAVSTVRTNMVFRGELYFRENSGTYGGAMALCGSSRIYLTHRTNISFISNSAVQAGGGLYIYQDCDYCNTPCFYQLHQKNIPRELNWADVHAIAKNITVRLLFSGNKAANYSGTHIYGGLMNTCYLYQIAEPTAGLNLFKAIFRFEAPQKYSDDSSMISSDPTRLCLCNENLPDCKPSDGKYPPLQNEVYPGETFGILAAAVGQVNGTTPGTVTAKLLGGERAAHLGHLQESQGLARNCTMLNYTVYSCTKSVTLFLAIEEGMPHSHPFVWAQVPVHLHSCPLGFELLENCGCECAQRLSAAHPSVSCNINDQSISRPAPVWIGHFDNRSKSLIVHSHCPYDYCKSESVLVTLNNSYCSWFGSEGPDNQCAFNRCGILCGSCLPGLSQTFGPSSCKECSDEYLLLLPAFAAAGIALLFLLILLNLTVSEGTVNGLVFFANIVRANSPLFFTSAMQGKFRVLTIFITWLNLDLGIETCFYNGLDAYAKAWLQFVFPAYIWTLMILVIILSHYYTFAARLSGRNAVQVLATLFLLSYAKLQRSIITILSFTKIDGLDWPVWLYDGDVKYLHGKHVPLFIAGVLCLVVLTIPYTLLLLLLRCLQRWSNLRVFWWVVKMKPLFDAYMGPYRDDFCFWTGLLLLARSTLFLVYTLNVLNEPNIDLFVTALAAYVLLASILVFRGVYKRRCLDLLEAFFFLNLGVLSVATMYDRKAGQGRHQTAISCISIGLSFIVFAGVIVFHACKCITSSRVWRTADLNSTFDCQWLTRGWEYFQRWISFCSSRQPFCALIRDSEDSNETQPLMRPT